MSEEKIEEAINEANASNKIEDLNINKKERDFIKQSLEEDKSDESFFYNLVKKIEDNKNHGKKK